MIVVQTNTPNKQCGTILISSKRNVSRAILPESPGGIKHVEGGGGGGGGGKINGTSTSGNR